MVCLALALGLRAANPKPEELYKRGRLAEREGDVVRAYLLYSLAAGQDPANPMYWARSQALRTQAALKARPKPSTGIAIRADAPESGTEAAAVSDTITEADLAEARRLQPPPELKASPGRKTLDLEGDAKAIFEQTARAYELDVVFDGDYEAGPVLRVRIENADYREALHQLEAATGSFVVVLAERLFLVAKDTPQKRAEVEPTVAVTIPIPHPVSVQEAQELARAIQQAMEILKFGVDSQRRLVFMRDRISKVRPAQVLFEQLLHHKPQVAVELELLEVDRNLLLAYGLATPTEFPIFNFSRIWNSVPSFPVNIARVVVFGGGRTVFGIGLGDAELFANMSESSARTLLRAELHSVAGQPASFHVGDQYPVMTAGYFGSTGGFQTFTPPPSFNFTDLGLVLKYVPWVHGMEEVTLELEAEFKLLAGQSVNGIPIISNRRISSKVRLKTGEWAMVAGLMTSSEARTISGLAGLSSLPVLGALFRRNTTTRDSTEVVLLLKPRLLSLPPTELPTPPMYVGTEARLRTPL